MRRLISMLAAGLLSAGTAVTGAGVAGASTAAAHQPTCASGNFFHVTSNSVNYYLGTPNLGLSPGQSPGLIV